VLEQRRDRVAVARPPVGPAIGRVRDPRRHQGRAWQPPALATWPAVFVEELAGLLEVLSGLVVGGEIAELQKRVDPPPAKLIAIEAAPAAGATA